MLNLYDKMHNNTFLRNPKKPALAELSVITQNKITPYKDTKMKEERDIEKTYSNKDFVSKLRRLADAIENGKRFEIQIAGERIYVPIRAEFNIEHEREGAEEEIEFQIKWKNEK